MENKKPMTQIAGKIVCYNCQSKRLNDSGNPYPIRKLEIFRKSNNPKSKSKGKVIAQAWVCGLCYSEGHNKVPFGSFNGEMKVAPALPKEMLDFLQKQKEEAIKKVEAEKQGETPAHPTKKD